MILDLPPKVQTVIEQTAIAQGITAEELVTISLTRQFVESSFDFDINELQKSIDSGFTPAIPDEAVQDLVSFEKWLQSV